MAAPVRLFRFVNQHHTTHENWAIEPIFDGGATALQTIDIPQDYRCIANPPNTLLRSRDRFPIRRNGKGRGGRQLRIS